MDIERLERWASSAGETPDDYAEGYEDAKKFVHDLLNGLLRPENDNEDQAGTNT